MVGLGSMPVSANDLDAKFLIKRKGKVIGFHHVNVDETDEGYKVDTSIEMKVKFGPIPLFKYTHTATEEWVGEEIVLLSTRTNNNGKKLRLDAERSSEGLMIEGTDYTGYAPEGALPSSYWNKNLVSSDQMINTQTGEIIDLTTEFLGKTKSPAGEMADHFCLTGTVALNIWYDGEQWVGSNFEIDGEVLDYEFVEAETHYGELEAFLN